MKKNTVISICISCRDNKENFYVDRGGSRLSQNVYKQLKKEKGVDIRGVKCMSNCKRACILSISSQNGFTYMFGDIDPMNSDYVKSLKDLILIYKSKTDGFLLRKERPNLFKSNIVGRFPPLNSVSPIVTKVNDK